MECLYYLVSRPTVGHCNEDRVVTASNISKWIERQSRTREQTYTWVNNWFSTKAWSGQSRVFSINGGGTRLLSWTSEWTSPSGPHIVHKNQLGMHWVCKHKRQNCNPSGNTTNDYLHDFGVGIYSPDKSPKTIIIKNITDELVFISI